MWSLLIFLVSVPTVALAAGYCSTNTFATNTSWLQFTKEPIPIEYAFENSFKSIHCCGKGYRSIEWFKNDVPYPWSANVSSLILYPEAANQTLYTRGSSRHDAGDYSCRVSNETDSLTHTVRLEVVDKNLESPKTMFLSPDQWVEEGNSVRLYCEALLGQSYLADATNELRWRKVSPNYTEGELLPSQLEVSTSREDNADILGAYLIIPTVSSIDYGTYVCAIHSNEIVSKRYVTIHYKAGLFGYDSGASELPWRGMLLFTMCACAFLVTVVVLHKKYTPRVLLSLRLMHGRATRSIQRDRILDKEFDVAVCYTQVDAELVHGALLNTLTNKYGYRVLPVCLSPPEDWYKSVYGELHKCRSLVCVVSPAQYSRSQLLLVLKQLHALPMQPVVVLLQDVPKLKREAKDEHGATLVSVLRRTRLIPWRHLHDREFWTSLRLALPLPPPPPAQKSSKSEHPDMKMSCSGSLDALV